MPAPTISTLPTAPIRTDAPATFSARAEAWVAALEAWTSQVNAFGDYLGTLGVTPADAAEAARDALGTALVAGSGITITPSDAADTIEIAAVPAAKSFSLGTFMVENIEANQVLLDWAFTFAGTFPDDFLTSQIPAPDTNPAATWTASVTLNGSAVGSISISTAGVVVKTTTGGALNFMAGNRLRVIGPATADASIRGVSMTFEGTR